MVSLLWVLHYYCLFHRTRIPFPKRRHQHISASEFFIQTNKQDLNKLINHYIEKEGLNGPVHYNVLLTDEVELYGEVKVFSESMQLKMTFEPRALENGDLVLEQKTLSLGGVPVPVSYILTFIRDYINFPTGSPFNRMINKSMLHFRK